METSKSATDPLVIKTSTNVNDHSKPEENEEA